MATCPYFLTPAQLWNMKPDPEGKCWCTHQPAWEAVSCPVNHNPELPALADIPAALPCTTSLAAGSPYLVMQTLVLLETGSLFWGHGKWESVDNKAWGRGSSVIESVRSSQRWGGAGCNDAGARQCKASGVLCVWCAWWFAFCCKNALASWNQSFLVWIRWNLTCVEGGKFSRASLECILGWKGTSGP